MDCLLLSLILNIILLFILFYTKKESFTSIWSPPNSINFPNAINKIDIIEKRMPQYLPNEELFSVEGYRAGDWNVNGYTAMQMMKKIKSKQKKEGFSNAPTVNNFLKFTREAEDQPERNPTRLADIPLKENFNYEIAKDTKKKLNNVMDIEDQRYYLSENFDPKLALNSKYSLNKLMDKEDKNYYLGEQWFPPKYYSDPLFMQKWEDKFKKTHIPSSLTESMTKIEKQEPRDYN